MPRKEWYDDAACIGHPLSVFFPEDDNFEPALAICAGCEVKQQCLQFAIRVERSLTWSFGVYGGLAPYKRRDMIERGFRA
jgi:hypothetical protein